MVDYIDNDNYMTPFHWTANSPNGNYQPAAAFTGAVAGFEPTGNGYVFGTELPKLVVNEVYLEYDNDQTDPTGMPKKATKAYHMNVWAELVNPLPSTPDPNSPPGGIQVNNDAVLVNGTACPYLDVAGKGHVVSGHQQVASAVEGHGIGLIELSGG